MTSEPWWGPKAGRSSGERTGVKIWKGFGRTYIASGEGSLENGVVLEMFYVFPHDFFYTMINMFGRQNTTNITALLMSPF